MPSQMEDIQARLATVELRLEALQHHLEAIAGRQSILQEDQQDIFTVILSIETTLGIRPQGECVDIAARLKAIEHDMLRYKGDV